MQYGADFTALKIDQEVLLFCTTRNGQQTMCLARMHWFHKAAEPGKPAPASVKAWQSTWNGDPLPEDWSPYAYAIITPPDPALLEDDYA